MKKDGDAVDEWRRMRQQISTKDGRKSYPFKNIDQVWHKAKHPVFSQSTTLVNSHNFF